MYCKKPGSWRNGAIEGVRRHADTAHFENTRLRRNGVMRYGAWRHDHEVHGAGVIVAHGAYVIAGVRGVMS
jgi:hypothetical protein